MFNPTMYLIMSGDLIVGSAILLPTGSIATELFGLAGGNFSNLPHDYHVVRVN